MRRLVTWIRNAVLLLGIVLFFPLAIIALGLPLVAIVRLAALLLGT
jgi:hypothetical protein